MPEEFPKNYEAKEIEPQIYKMWEALGYFNPDKLTKGKNDKKQKTFSMVLPPPNVTGSLHIGHAAMLAIQDILARYHRMKGDKTLWIPGTDHAAIATQEKVEREMYRKENKNRHDLGREEFLKRVNEFAQTSHDTIVHQIKSLGASLDWSREAFTLDEPRSLAVRTAFKKMYDAGLIYRGNRIVNWDPKLQTTVSDDEIEWLEEKTSFYYLKYGPFVISTARPETKFGDKYVVIHPLDKRYGQYEQGQKIEVEWINGPITATVIKDKAVDMKFGTGVMTITPWHDATDFEIAQRHKLDMEQIIDLRGKLLPIAGEFAGKKIKEARALIVEKLKTKGLLEKIDDNYTHRIATNSRGGGMIEPQILKQWFVDVNKKFVLNHSKIKGIKSGSKTTLKEIMTKAVKSGQIKITPKRFEKIYFHWIKNLRDWCISRQIWYGHQIPVWYKDISNLKAQKSKLWDLKIYGTDIFDALADGTKKIETRAGREKNAGKYWGDMQAGDIIEFRLADAKTDAIIESAPVIRKKIKNVKQFKTISELLKIYNAGDNYPGKSAKQIEAWWQSRPELYERIKKYGIWVIELTDTEEIYVDVNPPSGENWQQDPDTLDTWFSSGLWTFSTLGWPFDATQGKPKEDFINFHPTSVLETGYDILFFWVARMILMTGFLLGDVPFENVYLHGLVRDAQGRKMSKSLGNTIDPLDMANKYGADATRLSLIIGAAPGNDIKLSEDKIRGYRNFSTKLWNIARFIEMSDKAGLEAAKIKMTLADKEKIKAFAAVKKSVTQDIEAFRFHLASENLYHYVWHTFADKIIEEAKPRLQDGTPADQAATLAMLKEILFGCVKLLHPFIPFITEEIYQKMFKKDSSPASLMIETW